MDWIDDLKDSGNHLDKPTKLLAGFYYAKRRCEEECGSNIGFHLSFVDDRTMYFYYNRQPTYAGGSLYIPDFSLAKIIISYDIKSGEVIESEFNAENVYEEMSDEDIKQTKINMGKMTEDPKTLRWL